MRLLRLMWRYRKCTVCAAMVALLLMLLNIIAYDQAYAMTHFQTSGARTRSPEALSLLEKLKVLLVGVNIPRPTNWADPRSQGLDFQTVRFRGKDGLNLEAWSIPCPDAKGLVLLAHGHAACKATLLAEARFFHDLGFDTALLDFRGSGGSEGNETTIGVLEADDLAAAVENLQAVQPSRSLILYGQSMGSVAILRAIAEKHVQPTAAILECPFDRLISTVENRVRVMGLPAFPCAQLLVFWGGVQHRFNGFHHNPVEYAERVHCPVLLLHGNMDPFVTAEEARAVFDHLAGEKDIELFPNVGHQPCLPANPERWQRRVSDFLVRYAHGPASGH